MKSRILWSVIALFLLSGCIIGDFFNNLLSEEDVLLTKYVDASISDVTVKLDNGLEIFLPKGSTSGSEVLKITEVLDAPNTSGDEYKIHEVYDVTLGDITSFDVPITITFKYQQEELSVSSALADIKGVYLKDSLNKWCLYNNTTIDSVNHLISFETNHLTKVGWCEWLTAGIYNRKFVTDNFTIYYSFTGANAPMENSEYNNYNIEPWYDLEGNNAGTPFLVQDMGHWLEESYDQYISKYHFQRIDNDTSNINVYVKQIEADGLYGNWVGVLYLRSNLTVLAALKDYKLSPSEALRSAAAHELLHLFQDTYYEMVLPIHFWWLEATATLGDQLVWGDQFRIPESWIYVAKSTNHCTNCEIILDYCIAHSWDDCNVEPFWYGAGVFLNYLAFQNEGIKIDMADLIKKCGNSSEIGYIRTYLNNYLEDNHNTSLSDQFESYVKWLSFGDIAPEVKNYKLRYSPYSSVPNGNSAFEYPVLLSDNTLNVTFEEELGHLSARMLKLKNLNVIENQKVKIYGKYIPDGVKVYLCDYDAKTLNLVQQIQEGDELIIDLHGNIPGSRKVRELLLINKNLNDDLTPQIEMELLVNQPIINSIAPSKAKPGETITLSGANFVAQMPAGSMVGLNGESMSLVSWSDKEIKCTLPSDAVSGYIYVMVGGEKSNELYYEIGDDLNWPANYFCKEFSISLGVDCGGPWGKNISLGHNDKILTGGNGTYTYSLNEEIKEDIDENTNACGKRYTQMTYTRNYSITLTISPNSNHETGKISIDFRKFDKTEKTGDGVKYEKSTNKQLMIKNYPISLGAFPEINKSTYASTTKDAKNFLQYIEKAVLDEIIIDCNGNKTEQSLCTPDEVNINSYSLFIKLESQ